MDIRLDLNAEAVIAELNALGRDISDRAMASALNKTATTVRAEAARRISKELAGSAPVGINQARKFIRIIRANRSNLLAIVEAEGLLLVPLIKSRVPRPPHSFAQTMRSGHKGIYIRAPTGERQVMPNITYRPNRMKKTGSDLPIAEIFTPGVKATFAQEKVLEALKAVAIERFAVVIDQELRRFSRG